MIVITTRKVLYLAGPIAADKHSDFRFMDASVKLRDAGYDVVNPFLIDPKDHIAGFAALLGKEREFAQLRADLICMLKCDGVATLPMNYSSPGMAREMALAFSLDIPVQPVEAWLQEGTYA